LGVFLANEPMSFAVLNPSKDRMDLHWGQPLFLFKRYRFLMCLYNCRVV
jgi:hypothetical protein